MSIVVDAGARIIVSGRSHDLANSNVMAIWVYDSNGNPDPAFGMTGLVWSTTPPGGSADGRAIALDASGRIYIAGFGGNPPGMVIWRYEPAGGEDLSFSLNGFDVQVGGYGFDLVVDRCDRALVVGRSSNPGPTDDMAIWRFH